VKAICSGQFIAESNDTVVVEGNPYFSLQSVKKEYLESSSHASICRWKGAANYYTLKVDGEENKNAVWYYQEPSSAASATDQRSRGILEGRHRTAVGLATILEGKMPWGIRINSPEPWPRTASAGPRFDSDPML
jgi:Domain of unknown function (DUF427)